MAKSVVSAGTGLYQKTTLKNGLRVLTERMPSVRSVSMGVWVDVGSRNETAEESGLSHLIEHMVFKGTRNRSAKEIAASLESIGGSLNAFTSKEQTCFTARILDEHLEIAVDVLSDLACNAKVTPVDLEREKLVVYEEIKEVKDTPADYVNDLFAKTFWGDHPLGRPILGEIESLSPMTRRTILNYIRRNYRSESIVLAAAGSVSHRKLVDLARRKFTFGDGRAEPYAPAHRTVSREIQLEPSDNHQIHVCLGYPCIDYGSPERMIAAVLQTYLGGGMSSVLFQKIREEKGLAYTVYMFNELYRDSGIIGAYLAADKGNLKPCMEITLKELQRVKKRRLSATQLDQTKAQLKGQFTLGTESTSARMNRLARMELVLGKYIPLKESLAAVEKVTSSQVLEMANRLFDNSQMALSVLGAANKRALKDVL